MYLSGMINRLQEIKKIRGSLRHFPVVGILGARQVGKTTLARRLASQWEGPVTFFDLESPEDLSRLEDPLLALRNLKGLVVFDEIQRQAGLFPILRVLADRAGKPARFLILGSASPELLRQGSESLAGRVIFHELEGFSLEETGAAHWEKLWLRGGFPESYLTNPEPASFEWRSAFINTFLERDLPQLGIAIRSATLRRFWTMLAHYHGQKWNASDFARSFGVADTTVRHYLDILTSSLVVRQLLPWHENIGKRQVKAPKIYIKDSGLLHALLNLRSLKDLEGHPKVGASWEGFVIGQVVKRLGASPHECHYWATFTGAELDLLIVRGRLRWGFEVKRTASPGLTPSVRSAMESLKLKRLDVIHAGDKTFPLAGKIRAVAFSRLLEDMDPLE